VATEVTGKEGGPIQTQTEAVIEIKIATDYNETRWRLKELGKLKNDGTLPPSL